MQLAKIRIKKTMNDQMTTNDIFYKIINISMRFALSPMRKL